MLNNAMFELYSRWVPWHRFRILLRHSDNNFNNNNNTDHGLFRFPTYKLAFNRRITKREYVLKKKYGKMKK